jgi:hypothetical protein
MGGKIQVEVFDFGAQGAVFSGFGSLALQAFSLRAKGPQHIIETIHV